MKKFAEKHGGLLFLVAGILLIAVLGVMVALMGGGGNSSKGPDVSTAKPGGGPLGKTVYVGWSKGRYYGRTLVFKVPSSVQHLTPQKAADYSDQLTFTFKDGQGVISSQPLGGAEGLPQLRSMYQGKQRAIRIAKKPGFYSETRAGGANIVIAAVIAGPQRLTIQLSSTQSSGEVVSLLQQVASNLKVRRVAE